MGNEIDEKNQTDKWKQMLLDIGVPETKISILNLE